MHVRAVRVERGSRVIPFFNWGVAYKPRLTSKPPEDKRLAPVDGDDIDELVNEQLARGRSGDLK